MVTYVLSKYNVVLCPIPQHTIPPSRNASLPCYKSCLGVCASFSPLYSTDIIIPMLHCIYEVYKPLLWCIKWK